MKHVDVAKAMMKMMEVIPFFPTTDIGLQVVQEAIESFVTTTEQLDWLVKTACAQMRRFSLPELRGIFCSRFPPKDGMYAAAETPGFTPEDGERAYHEREAAIVDQRIERWKREAKLLGISPGPLLSNPAPALKRKSMPPVEEPPKPRLQEVEKDFADEQAETARRSPEENARLLAELQYELKKKIN